MRRCFKSLVSRHFSRSYLKANEVSKSEGAMKVEMHVTSESVLMLFTQNYRNQSMLFENTARQSPLVFFHSAVE